MGSSLFWWSPIYPYFFFTISTFCVLLKYSLPFHLLGILRQKKKMWRTTAIESKPQSDWTLLDSRFWIGFLAFWALVLTKHFRFYKALYRSISWSHAGTHWGTCRRDWSILMAEDLGGQQELSGGLWCLHICHGLVCKDDALDSQV